MNNLPWKGYTFNIGTSHGLPGPLISYTMAPIKPEGQVKSEEIERATRIRKLSAYRWLKPAEEQELARLRSGGPLTHEVKTGGNNLQKPNIQTP